MVVTPGTDWTDVEVNAVVDSYFGMLRREMAGEKFNKAAENRRLQERIGRSKGSIEFKHQNISAVIIEARGIPIDGYKPMSNVQERLRSAVLARFERDDTLRQQMLRSVTDVGGYFTDAPVDLQFHPNPPVLDLGRHSRVRPRVGRFVDYQQLEAQRRDLGAAGELAIIAYEQRILRAAGHQKLAERVEHVALTQGDGTGYDILSFEPSGKEKFIEVKTTRSFMQLPFLVTRNEVSFSGESQDQFHLYRLFQFGKPKAGFYSLCGSLEETAQLDPVVYEGRPA